MPTLSVGDLRQHLFTVQRNTDLKNELATLSQELSTGEKGDLTKHLGHRQSQLTALDRSLATLKSYGDSNKETGQLLNVMQISLAQVDTQRHQASNALLTIDETSQSSELKNAAQVARDGFYAAVNALNARFDGRTLFGGRDTQTNALASPDEMLSAIKVELSGLTDAGSIASALDSWFDAPGGGFEQFGFLGDENGFLKKNINSGEAIELNARADDVAIRTVLKPLAKAALSLDSTLSLSKETTRALQKQAGLNLFEAASGLTGLQAAAGFNQGRVEEAKTQIEAERSTYSIARNDIVNADPFETAGRLQAIQVQLETHFSLTARLSRLTLLEYLR